MNAALDAVVCLLLVSAAVVGLVTVEQSPPATPGRADAVADTLATSTAQVEYSLAPGARQLAAQKSDAAISPSSPELDRTAHGSLAALLARAATATSGVDLSDPTASTDPSAIDPLTRTRASFRRGVVDAVRARTGGTVRVDATWLPYPGAPVAGSVAVGPTPPRESVHAATLVMPTGVEPIPTSAESDFETLALAVAERTVAVLVPAGPAKTTLRGNDPAAALVRHRYARLEAATNVSLAAPLSTEDTAAANEQLAAALRPRIERDLRNRYESPEAAAAAVSVDTVSIVVRTWSASSEAR